ncbi:hypothetical protein K505DRAFT_380566 [Melanomma pulvis-pyrius CBS 109.77]|uniref:Uncharacterized protein n=1 Tax=Melanomma pulvis-pyrius CBS 109.77 TaxID=1314802 RepID=A0A6A6WPW8_9PLEO|nr:hypothetical protein K505DRAFT_380566 [Melanomma pulvis-pyrius CBS 109.77]
MPLPDEALSVEGGCNCGAVRYRVAIPALAERPLHPLAPAETPVPLPFLVLDHCNDCRRATGSLLPAWLCAPIEMASVSLVQASSATLAPKAAAREGQAKELGGAWTPAADIFTPAPTGTDHFLKNYESSHERWRWFCARCGTSIAYTAVMPAGFPNMLDITMGSVDRRHLETNALVPERHLWWDYGIDWIRRLATEGYGALPIHPDYRIADTVKRPNLS